MATVPRDAALDHTLLHRLFDARRRSDALFDIVKSDAIFERPIPERHRIIFYVGHLEAFDWNLLHENVGLEAFHPEFDRLFAFGIDPVGGGLPSDQPSDWPSLDQVRAYQRRIRETLDEGVQKVLSATSSDQHPSATQLLNVAIEHRLMHAETFTYMLHQMPLDRKRRNPHLAPAPAVQVRPTVVEIPEGSATLGLSRTADRFGWDNEYESHVVEVP